MSVIKPINYEEITKLLRQTVISCTGLKPERVLNALSARGTDLSELITSSQAYSFDMGKCFILFELLRDPSDEDNYVTPEGDDKMLAITTYVLHLLVYGNGSDACAQRLRASFKDPSIALSLREQGIFVKTATAGETVHEFVNNTMLLRVDIDIRFTSTQSISKLSEQQYFATNGFLGANEGLIIKDADEV